MSRLHQEVAEAYSKAERVVIALLPRYGATPAVQDYARQVQSVLQQLRDIALDGLPPPSPPPAAGPPPPPPPPSPPPPRTRRPNMPRARWAELLSRVHAGERRRALAAEYGVTTTAIAMQLARERKTS